MAAYADDGAWLEAHAAQFEAIGLPRELWKEAARKVRAQLFDGGAALTYAVEADGGWSVVAARDLEGMHVWLVDHVWLVKDAFAAFTQLEAHEALRDRLDVLVRPHGTASRQYGSAEATLDLLKTLAPLAHPIRLASDAAAAARGGDVTYYVQDELGSRLKTVGVDGVEHATAGRAALYDMATNATLSLLWITAPLEAGQDLVVPQLPGLELLEDHAAYWARRMDAEEVFEWYCPFTAIADVVARVLAPYDEYLAGRGAARNPAAVDAGVQEFTDRLDSLRFCPADEEAFLTRAENAIAARQAELALCSGLVLVSGNGTSDLPVELEAAHAGVRIVAADYADNATQRMRKRHAKSRVTWVTGDLTKSFAPFCVDESAALVLDKGCLDAMLIKPMRDRGGADDTWVSTSPDALAYLAAARACLKKSGVVLVITLGRRAMREPLFAAAGLVVREWLAVAPTASMKAGKHADAGAGDLHVTVLGRADADLSDALQASAIR